MPTRALTSRCLALIFGLLIGRAPASAETAANVGDYAAITARLSEFIEYERREKDLPAVSIALVDGDRIAWSTGFGFADPVAKKSATGETVYRVGSVSKLFTDLAVMQLAAEGKLDIDADVRIYLPDFAPENPYGTPITLRLLMSHQSGLVREPPVGHYFDPTDPTLAETVRSLNNTKLVYKPGARTKYSNAGIAVAGMVVERLIGKPFAEHAQAALLEPLAMKSSGFRRTPAIDEATARSWMWARHLPRFESPTFLLGTLPAGNLYASVDDLAHLIIAVFGRGEFGGRQIVAPETLDAMMKPVVGAEEEVHNYGIGFRLGELDGHKTFGHGGAVYGYSTQVTGLAEEKLGVVAVCALDGSDGFVRRLTEYALRLMLAQKSAENVPAPETTSPLAPGDARKLEGVYVDGADRVELQGFGDRLFLLYDYALTEVRQAPSGLVLDDPTTFGPAIVVQDDGALVLADRTWRRGEDACPPKCPPRWQGLLGEYGWDHNVLYVYEDFGQLWVLIEWFSYYPLTEVSDGVFAFPDVGLYHGEQIVFGRDGNGVANEAVAAGVPFKRRPLGEFQGDVFQVRPAQPFDALLKAARDASPPTETRPKREPDLVDLAALEPSIKLDIRYATKRNFMSTPFYNSARAFLQRPAAEAVIGAHRKLKDLGYGLLVFDGYRPWYVTKMFWNAMPPALRHFVADPEQGSRHNRGCAVDLTLYDLASGEPVEMVGGYDEFSPRSYPLYPGGDRRQRWHRALLRRTMEDEGFSVYDFEWWHFDFRDWRQYPLLNVPFEDLAAPP